MRRRLAFFVLFAPAALIVLFAGCEDEAKTCYPGDYVGCYCPTGAWGYAQCLSFERYGPCECIATPGLDAAGPLEGGAEAGSGGGRDAGRADADADAADAADAGATDGAADAGDAEAGT